MAKKHRTPEQIIHLLRQAEVETAGGQPLAQVCRKLGVSEQTYYRWRKEYGGAPHRPGEKIEGPGAGERPAEDAPGRGRGRGRAGRGHPAGGRRGELLSPAKRRDAHAPGDEPALGRRMTELATTYGRHGYRRITALPRASPSTASGSSGGGGRG